MKKNVASGFEDNGFEGWGGYMAAKKAKLQEQFLLQAGKEVPSSSKSNIFQGVAIFVNGYTVPSADELKRIMILHGGLYHHYETAKTTHIIATNLPDCKVKRLKVLKVVRPEWITDSLAAGRLLDHHAYLLYSNQSKCQPQMLFSGKPIKPDIALHSCANSKSDSEAIVTVPVTSAGHMRNNNLVSVSGHDTNNIPYCEGGITLLSKSDSANSIPLPALQICNDSSSVVSFTCRAMDYGDADPSDVNPYRLTTNRATCKKPLDYSKAPVQTAVEPKFLSEFYSNSRLHHISTMGATFKQYVTQLREQKKGEGFPGRERLAKWKRTKYPKLNESVGEDMVRDEEDMLMDCQEKYTGAKKTIMHIDMDCFFVSVGLRDRPELRGLPVAVTHARGNPSHQRSSAANPQFEIEYYKQRRENKMKLKHGSNKSDECVKEDETHHWFDEIDENCSMSEIASCNYEARKYGLKNGMFLGAALKLCPNLKTIPYDFEGYKEVSYTLYNTVANYTLEIEAVSCDEMFVDCTEILKETATSPVEFAAFLRQEIKAKTGCPASAGFGSNPLQARLATRKAKPDGQFYLQPAIVGGFMKPIKVEDLPGVGHTLAYRLHSQGIATCGQLQECSLNQLKKQFGEKTGEALYKHSRGQDDRQLAASHQRKSVSAEVNYGIRFTTQSEADTFLRQLAGEVHSRLTQVGMKGRCITLKLMVRAKDAPTETAKYLGHGVCNHITRSSTLSVATSNAEIIAREVVSLEHQLSVPANDLRGIGIQVSRLQSAAKGPRILADFLLRRENKQKAGDVVVPQKESVAPSVLYPTCASGVEEKQIQPEDNQLKVSDCNARHQTACPASIPEESAVYKLKVKEPIMSLEQARHVVREWVGSEMEPRHCDVVLLAQYTQQLAAARHIAALDILLRQLFRCITKQKCSKWQAAYYYILNKAQDTVHRVYGTRLKARENFSSC